MEHIIILVELFEYRQNLLSIFSESKIVLLKYNGTYSISPSLSMVGQVQPSYLKGITNVYIFLSQTRVSNRPR